MSAIATFELLPKSSIEGLRTAAVPTKSGWFKGSTDNFRDFLKSNSREVVQYNWSGWVLGTLLAYLDEKHSINLTKSSYDELSEFLSKTRGSTYFVLTDDHQRNYQEKLNPALFSEDELRDYSNEFNAADEPESGRPMIDGIRAFFTALKAVDDQSVILLSIG